ncbi:hypothetical protein PsAD2_02221 [Pseudovibrio axinellae]|uniref:Uncharacterized protein n=1 Tax=Pseudovibrio axinellae TaxID=989403 RepID=A0A165YC50_9HYPH|nr:hypothetical protein [Pseudovibrio axinellae]KZL18706.1 hypothetical protein PsAD2_02221 [Pseudovibrio axinellae]SEP96037.1 hypothetical protein SAMN05421798_101820 [Pseudovibrio axinellae]
MSFTIRGMRAFAKAATCSIFSVTLLGSAASAEDATTLSADFNGAREGYAAAWQQQPLAFTAAKFIALPAESYGSYTPLENTEFQSGDPLIVYAEPVGFAIKEMNGEYAIDLSVDFELINTTGQVLASQEGFTTLHSKSFNQIREYQSSLSFNLTSLQAGEYKLKIRFNDVNSNKTGSFVLPFSMKEAPLQN